MRGPREGGRIGAKLSDSGPRMADWARTSIGERSVSKRSVRERRSRALSKAPTHSRFFGTLADVSSGSGSGSSGSGGSISAASSSALSAGGWKSACSLISTAKKMASGTQTATSLRSCMAPEHATSCFGSSGAAAAAAAADYDGFVQEEKTIHTKRRAIPKAGLDEADEFHDDRLEQIFKRLWRHHRLIAPASFSPRKFAWDMAVVVFVMFNCIIVPVELCFSRADWLLDGTEEGRILSGCDQVGDF